MNIKEICLEEIEVHSSLVEESINCLLHTIIFLRHPKKVTPDDMSCTLLAPLTYAKCNIKSIDNDVRYSVDVFNRSMTSIGPNVSRGIIHLSYYEVSEQKGFFGLTSTTQKIYFERWKIPIIVNHNAFSSTRDEQGEIERERFRDSCRNQLHLRLLYIFQAANGEVDHVPVNVEYTYEITC